MRETFPKPSVIVITATALLTLAACDFFVADESRIQKATQLSKQGDHRTAVIELKKILQNHPDNGDARLLLGEVSLLAGDAAAAEKELLRAQELGIPREKLIVPLGRALLAQGQHGRVLADLDPNGVGDDEARAGVFLLRGNANLRLGKPAEAERAFREVLALRADSLDARLGLAALEEGRGNFNAADAYIADVLSRDPAYARGWLAKGQVQLRRSQYAQAEEDFASMLKQPLSALEEFAARDGLAESQWRQGKSDAALQNVERLMKLAPEHPRPRYFRALIAYGAGDYQTAVNYLQQVLQGFPDYRPAAFLLGASHYARGDLEQAEMYLRNVLAADPSSATARKLLAATRLRQQKPQDAMTTLAPALARDSNDGQLLALMGRASLQAGDADAGLMYLERGAAANPENQALRMQLATGYVTAGDLDHAIKLLEGMPETKDGVYGRELLLILAYLRKGDNESALGQVQNLLATRPNDPGAYNLAGNVYVAVGQLPRAREQFEKALQLQPDNLTVLKSVGRLELREGKQDDARIRFERVLALSAKDLNAMVALAELAAVRGDQAGVVQWLERASTANPEAMEPRLRLLGHYLATGDLERARSLAVELEKASPENADVQNALGIVQMADRKYEQAVTTFHKAIAAAPNSPNFTYNLARTQLVRQHRDEAKKLLAKTLELQPDHLAAASALAALEMEEGNAQQALARARALQRGKDTGAAGWALEGDLHMGRHKFDDAARAYDTALKEAPSALLTIKSYQARSQGHIPDANRSLEQWLSKHPDDAGVRLVLAQSYQERRQFAQAAAEYERILKNSPEHAVTLNNLAWMYHEAKDPRALPTAERAHQLQPDSGAITDTLGWLLVQEDQAQRAVELLRKAVQQAPKSPDIRYHLAVALAKTGANEEARRTLAELVSSGQAFPELAEAKQLLRQLQ